MIDVDEYLHLALHASAANDPHACLGYLKQVLQQQPKHPQALYLLATQHVQLGLFERGMAGLKAALALEPGLEMAHFQLGVLLLDRRQTDEARRHFADLSRSPDQALRSYAEAMIALADDDSALAQRCIVMGLARRQLNSPLAVFMRRMLKQLAGTPAAIPSLPEDVAAEVESNYIFMGAYHQGQREQ
jgi:tetratricopeptide (TPR) repeat protein